MDVDYIHALLLCVRGLMRAILRLSFLIVSFPLLADTDLAFLILKSTVANSEKQPTWICMAQRGRCIHISADQEMVSIASGTYNFGHIDFMKDPNYKIGAHHFKNKTIFKFEAGNIYFIGDFRLQKKSVWRYELELFQDPSQIIKACAASPEIFEKYSVTDTVGGECFKVSCTAGKN